MELIELKNKILSHFHGDDVEKQQLVELIERDRAVYPFNEFELLISTLLAKESMTYHDYLEIRQEYISRNPNLWIFEISAPRGFGESFAQTYIQGKCSKLRNPTKYLDSEYHGDYDLWLDGIRIEVKASRVTDSEQDGPLYIKALSSYTDRPFLMNFQQLKPQCCDVFIWMAVYRDIISIWVMNSKEVQNHPDYSKGQHRGNKGNEGQLHITDGNIATLDPYLLGEKDLEQAVRDAYQRS